MTDPDCRVKVDHRGIARGLGISIGHTDSNGFVKPHDVAEIIREGSKHRELSRTRITENRIDANGAKEPQNGFTYRCAWVQSHTWSSAITIHWWSHKIRRQLPPVRAS